MADTTIAKIASILAKAERSDNEHEQEAYMQMAQVLSTKHSIDLDVARSHTQKKEERPKPEIRHIEIGEKGDRGSGAYSALFLEIAKINDVQLMLAYSGSYVDAYGMSNDIDHTEQLYAVLLVQMVRACREYTELGEWRKPGVTIWDARRSFYAGFRARVAQRLMIAKREAEKESHDYYAEQGVDTALVLRDKRQEVNTLYWQDARGKGHWNARSGNSRHAHRAGDHAGTKARIHRQDGVGSNKGSIEK